MTKGDKKYTINGANIPKEKSRMIIRKQNFPKKSEEKNQKRKVGREKKQGPIPKNALKTQTIHPHV